MSECRRSCTCSSGSNRRASHCPYQKLPRWGRNLRSRVWPRSPTRNSRTSNARDLVPGGRARPAVGTQGSDYGACQAWGIGGEATVRRCDVRNSDATPVGSGTGAVIRRNPLAVSGVSPACPCRGRRNPVSSSRRIARSMRISRTTRSCTASRQGLGGLRLSIDRESLPGGAE